jgi:hypothetical protein
MDPNSNLLEQRRIAKAILADPDAHSYGAVRLAELVEALDEWISRGGFRPTSWKGTN